MSVKRIDNLPKYRSKQSCIDPEHNPPNHLYIPAGETWEHTCPSCGHKTMMYSSSATY